MKTYLRFFSILIILGMITGCAKSTPTAIKETSLLEPTSYNLEEMAKTYVNQLAKGDYTNATAKFDEAMLKAAPSAKLKEIWEQLLAQTGAFQQQVGTRTDEQQGYKIVYVTCQFEQSAIDVKVVFNTQAQISGMSFSPAQATVSTQPGVSTNPLVLAAKDFVDQLAKGDYASARSSFNEKMANAVSTDQLKTIWDQLTAQLGDYKQQTAAHVTETGDYKSVYVTCEFAKDSVDIQVTYDAEMKVAGLHVVPAGTANATPVPYNPPAYVNPASFQESDVTVGSGDWALPGTLSMPKGAGPFPAVVLVHGSGPNDQDESIGPNKPFRDLAWGLASQGIAVLRYDKRTKVHAAKFTPEMVAKLTVNEETTDDALLAVQLLRQTENIDPKRIYAAGHSLGAMMAPRIGQQDPGLAGLIILAGPGRPLEDVIVEQYTYLYNLDGTLTGEEYANLKTIKTQVELAKSPGLSDQTPTKDLPLGMGAAYWLDLRDYQPAVVAKALNMRLLVLQGGRDYQVSPDKDFPVWQAALEGNSNATLKLYPALNHLFIAGEGQPNPQEYNQEGHVSEEVIADIGQWVLK